MLITIEGGEGSGKTSHIPELVESLRERGLKVFPTREPGGTSIGEQIREVLHDKKNTEMHPRTETLLYQSARAQTVEQVLKPRLDGGENIILDRFYDSTIAYQGYGHRQDIQQIKQLIGYATGGLTPDLTVLLDVDVDEGLARKHKQNELNRMDLLPRDFYERVNCGYHEMVKEEPNRWIVVNANHGILEVRQNLIKAVNERV